MPHYLADTSLIVDLTTTVAAGRRRRLPKAGGPRPGGEQDTTEDGALAAKNTGKHGNPFLSECAWRKPRVAVLFWEPVKLCDRLSASVFCSAHRQFCDFVTRYLYLILMLAGLREIVGRLQAQPVIGARPTGFF